MSGNKSIKKRELHSESSGIEELIAILPLHTPVQQTSCKFNTLECFWWASSPYFWPPALWEWCIPSVLPCTTAEVGVLDNARALVLQRQRERAVFSSDKCPLVKCVRLAAFHRQVGTWLWSFLEGI